MIYLDACIGRISFEKDGKLLHIEKHKDIEKYVESYGEKELILPGDEFLEKAMQTLKNKNLERDYREVNLKLTEHLLDKAATREHIAIHIESAIEEKEEWINRFSKRLREMVKPWFFKKEHTLEDNKAFAEAILNEKIGVEADDRAFIQDMAKEVLLSFGEKEKMELHLEKMMKALMPNLASLCTPKLAARLLKEAGSLKRLVMMPSSTIQVLGAEKALFRHIKSKKGHKPPKHGVIFIHPLMQKAAKEKRGKIARTLADKISLAAKLDFFKGDFKGEELYREVEKAL